MRSVTRERRRAPVSNRALATVFGALVAWLVAGTHLASTLHFALISHRICAAHGELEHAHAHAVPSANDSTTTAAWRDSGEAEHEHCTLAGTPREELSLAAPARFAIAPAPRVETTSIARAKAKHPARATLLLFAPKQSPPV